MRIYRFLAISCVIAALCSCGSKDKQGSNPTADSTAVAAVEELPFPTVPADITDPTERANYVTERFWLAMDFRDTTRSRNRDFIEQNFVNFISFAPYSDEAVYRKAVKELLEKARKDEPGYELLADVAYQYLYDPNSPMLSEDLYIVFLEEMLKSPFPDMAAREKQAYQLETAQKNRPGMKAANFEYVTPDGKRSTLHNTAASGQLLLVFYDPDCDNCKSIISNLRNSQRLNQGIAENQLTVLAVYSGDDKDLWAKEAKEMPSNWIIGYEDGTLQDDERYILRASPTLYLLDSDKKVLAKDLRPEFLLGQ